MNTKNPVFEMNGYFNEFVFANVIQNHNNNVYKNKLDEPFITATEGRELHSDFVKNVEAKYSEKYGRNYDVSSCGKTVLLTSINETFRNKYGKNIISENKYDDVYNTYKKMFIKLAKNTCDFSREMNWLE